jgi:poly-gamma-glutamate synthesis protein (capsule biosynthesis protein)
MMKGKVVKKQYLLPLLIIIPFLAFFLYFAIKGINPVQGILLLTDISKPKITYDTFKISMGEGVSDSLSSYIKTTLGSIEFNDTPRFEFVDEENADYHIQPSGEGIPIIKQSFIPVGHIYWVKGDILPSEICKESLYVSNNISDVSLDLLKDQFNEDCVIEKRENLITSLKGSEDHIGLVLPSELTKEMKILKINDKGYLEESGASFQYSYTIEGEEESVEFVSSIIEKNMDLQIEDSLDTDNVVKVNMTGVTAITRGLAIRVDASKDYSYPAKSIGDFLANADLTHTSNEISFVDGCTSYSGMSFCSKPEYLETLLASGVDIIELTGNHNNDYGASYNTNSINIYKENNLDYFGGGLDDTDASKILYKEVKGNTIAFIGYNYYDTMQRTGAIATSTHAGANSYSVEKMEGDIKEAKEKADVVIVDFQFQECYSYPQSDVIYPICYKPLSSPDQKEVFRMAVDFGADIVIGTQAHQPQTYELYNGGTIFYGLGNLYFDQTRWIGTRQGLVISLYISEGRVIQTELTPTIYEKDMITRVANGDEAKLLLELLKSARTF